MADPEAGIALTGVGYGAVSDYQDVPPGTYTVSMREAGADPTTPPVLSTTVEVGSGTARTVAGVGLFADLGLEVIDDDLETAARAGEARVRVLAGGRRMRRRLDVTLADGTAVASRAGVRQRRATTSTSRPGPPRLQVAAEGGAPTDLPVDLAAGAVYSLLVLDDADGG